MEATTIFILSVLLILIGLTVVGVIVKKNEDHRPGTPIQWLAMGSSSLLIICGLAMLMVGFILNRDGVPVRYVQEESLGLQAPNFSFTRLSDLQEADIASYEGNVILLNFWATWCAPCLEEMPDLNRLQADYQDEGLVVLTLSDETPEELEAFGDLIPLNTVPGLIKDPRSLPMPYVKMLDGRPESYVIDRDGVLREFVLGARNYVYFNEIVKPYL